MANKKAPSRGWRLGRFGGSAGRTARRICVLSGATLPPIPRLTLSHRYSPNPCASCIPKNAWRAPIASRPVACRDGAREAELQREALSLGEARKYQFLRVADVDTHKTSSTRSVARLQCLYDVL